MASYRILIVEDQREVSRLLHSALETLEHDLQVDEIPSGEEAILDASRNKVDLLISDYRLPGITGIELMQKIKAYHPDLKVILITGLTDKKVRKEVSEAGADYFFVKPVPMADFLAAAERSLGLAQTVLSTESETAEGAEERENLADILSGLRKELKASAVILLNDRGRIQAMAGELPDKSVEVSLSASLMAIYSAGQKVLRLIGQKSPSDWHIFDGSDYDLIFAPVGTTHAMLAAGENLATEGKVLEVVRIFFAAREAIENILQPMVASAKTARVATATVPVEESTPEPKEEDLEQLFIQSKKKLKPEEVDAFWSEAAGKQKATPTEPDVLSYEQARQLGLAPEDDSK